MQDLVLAAGAVCWKVVDGKVRILLVHRTQHRDISLPKGKVDPGETLPETAVREIAEETGLDVALGAPLGTVDYILPNGRPKVVHYWAAEVDQLAVLNSTFAPNEEIASLEWVSVRKARKLMTYAHDLDVIDRFAELLDSGRARTFAMIVVRHGKAVPPETWDGPDSTRPLLHRGLDQSVSIAPAIAAYRPSRIVSSSAVRCMATITPLAELLGLTIKSTRLISQEAYENGQASVASVVAKRLAKGESAVLCSHGPVIPEIIEQLARATHSQLNRELSQAASLDTGEYTVLHIARDAPETGFVAVETHGPTYA